jgi:hypothetical protein
MRDLFGVGILDKLGILLGEPWVLRGLLFARFGLGFGDGGFGLGHLGVLGVL